jgi:hypothetical protein
VRQRTKAKNDHAAGTSDGLSVCEKVVESEFDLGPGFKGAAGVSRSVFGRQAF